MKILIYTYEHFHLHVLYEEEERIEITSTKRLRAENFKERLLLFTLQYFSPLSHVTHKYYIMHKDGPDYT
jgi:hypothetical protein